MAMFDNNLLSEEDLNNIDNEKEGDGDLDDSSSDKEEMKRISKVDKKEVDELNGRTNM